MVESFREGRARVEMSARNSLGGEDCKVDPDGEGYYFLEAGNTGECGVHDYQREKACAKNFGKIVLFFYYSVD